MNSTEKRISGVRLLFGLSVIHVMFNDKVDDFYARQQVYNLLNDADLPEGGDAGGTAVVRAYGETFRYTNMQRQKRTVRELKTFQDWVIERKLRRSQAADIVSFGGEVKTFEVSVNPNQLIVSGVTTFGAL